MLIFKKFLIESVCALLVCIRKLLGPIRCRYAIGCTTFTMQRLRTQPFGKAIGASARRLRSCTSWQPLKTDLFE